MFSKSKLCATRNVLKRNGQHHQDPVKRKSSGGEFGDSGESGDFDQTSAKLKLSLVDF